MGDTIKEERNSEDWNVDCSDDEKYETKQKWVTVGVRTVQHRRKLSPVSK